MVHIKHVEIYCFGYIFILKIGIRFWSLDIHKWKLIDPLLPILPDSIIAIIMSYVRVHQAQKKQDLITEMRLFNIPGVTSICEYHVILYNWDIVKRLPEGLNVKEIFDILGEEYHLEDEFCYQCMDHRMARESHKNKVNRFWDVFMRLRFKDGMLWSLNSAPKN